MPEIKVKKIHLLKIEDEYLKAIKNGIKTFELRKNDRDYQVGDLIKFSKDKDIYRITYILKDVKEYGLDSNYCILAIKKNDLKIVEVETEKENKKVGD